MIFTSNGNSFRKTSEIIDIINYNIHTFLIKDKLGLISDNK